ncbi:hypothetical protein ACTXGQ_07185 [Marinobacter sp. 1Y8]
MPAPIAIPAPFFQCSRAVFPIFRILPDTTDSDAVPNLCTVDAWKLNSGCPIVFNAEHPENLK